ncbi:hypothetical protein BDZ89DRAFT_1065382 [Hymenopellis radicata]|nr:hypothetical protein BDZ89DRAFT_1065382 [Hymenopellis radicata]
MAAEYDVETVIRRALYDAPTNHYAGQWVKKNPTQGIPCKYCQARNLFCEPRLVRIHCNNPECFSSSGGCSRLDEELFSRVTAVRPALEREEFDTVLANIRAEDAQSTPLTLKIRRQPAREMPPYPSPSSSSTAPASDNEKDPTVHDLRKQLSESQALIFSHDKMLDHRAEKLLRLQAQMKESLNELETTRQQLAEEKKDKTKLEGEVSQLQSKVSDFEKEDVGGAMLFRDLQATISELRATTDHFEAERDALIEEKNVLQATVDTLKATQINRDAMSESLEDALRAQLEVVEAEKDKLSAEKHELQQRLDQVQAVEDRMPFANAQEQGALKTLAEKYAILQQEKDAILTRNAELEDWVRDATSISSSNNDALVTRLQPELGVLQTREKDKQLEGLKVQVATLREQCDTLRMEKMALVARMEDLEAAREQEHRDDQETVHLRQQLERTTHQLDVCKRKLDNARKHTVSVRTSYQQTFANTHLALTRLQHSLASSVGSDRLEWAVKTHIRELRKLREKVEEETPGTVDAIMRMTVKREEEMEESEDEDAGYSVAGGGGGNEEEEEGRLRKRPRLNS